MEIRARVPGAAGGYAPAVNARLRPTLPRAAHAALLVACVSVAWASGGWGTPLRGGGAKADIDGATDVDAWTLRAAAGAPLRIDVSTPRGSDLVPDVELTGPDGAPIAFSLRRKGRRVIVRDAGATAGPGLYQVTVSGDDGTTGAYRIRARSPGARKATARDVVVRPDEELRLPFGASGGARVSFDVRSPGAPLRFARIEDPFGRSVPVADDRVRARGKRLRGKGIRLPEGYAFGRWHLVLRGGASTLSGVRTRIQVQGGERLRSPRKLTGADLHIVALSASESGAGLPLTLTLDGEGDAAAFDVFLGGRRAEVVGRLGDQLRITVPDGPIGTTDVAVIHEDGRAAQLADALTLVAAPTIAGLTPETGPAAGGTQVELSGTGFRSGVAVFLGGNRVTPDPEPIDSTTLRFETPPLGTGGQDLVVVDPTGLQATRPAAFRYQLPPTVTSASPASVPAGLPSVLELEGGNLGLAEAILVDGEGRVVQGVVTRPPEATRMTVELPPLGVGAYELRVEDVHGQRAGGRRTVTAFEYRATVEHTFTGGPFPAAAAVADLDDDGDLDLVTVASGGPTLDAVGHLRVLRNDGDGQWSDETVQWVPDVGTDDWRGTTIAVGHLVGASGESTPDAYPDLVIGTTDKTVLPGVRSRVRILANRESPAGGRHFEDVTDTLMAVPISRDAWWAERVWVGDLDGDGGIPEIVATHDEPAFEVEEPAPQFVHHESGTRVFRLSGTPPRFRWEPTRLPSLLGVRQPSGSFPVCSEDECRDEYHTFEGVDLVVADLDGDTRKDFITTRPDPRTHRDLPASSTQLGRNVVGVVESFTPALPIQDTTYLARRALVGPLDDDALPDLVLLSADPVADGTVLELIVNGGLIRESWTRRGTDWLPDVAGETFRAHDGRLADLDGDGDLDLLLLRRTPDTGITRSLLPLRRAGAGLDTELDRLLPDLPELPAEALLLVEALHDRERETAAALLVLARAEGSSDTTLRVLRRTR